MKVTINHVQKTAGLTQRGNAAKVRCEPIADPRHRATSRLWDDVQVVNEKFLQSESS